MSSQPSSNPEAAKSGGSGTKQANGDRPLPRGHMAMADILDGKVNRGRIVHVMGIVKDCQLPIQSRGTDYKMAIKLFDKSIDAESRYLSLHIFDEKEKMPEVGPGDIVLAQAVKVQSYRDDMSLLTNYQSAVHVFSAAKIPKPPATAEAAWIRPKKSNRNAVPTYEEAQYVTFLYHSIDRSAVPTVVEFQEMTKRSLNTTDKFSPLQDVKPGQYHNLIARVVGTPYGGGESVSLWITDYSENPSFNDFPRPGMAARGNTQVGDKYNYLVDFSGVSRKTIDNWAGPYGKLSMQLTCYEPHASFVRAHVKAGSWVELENVHIKMGRNGASLEGLLHDDIAYGDPLRVSLIEWSMDNPEGIDPRLKDAVRRKRDYETQIKSVLKKRKQDQAKESNSDNAKARRKRMRHLQSGGENAENAVQVQDGGKKAKVSARNRLNRSVIPNHQGQGLTPLASVLEPIYHGLTLDSGEKTHVQLPFVNSKFRAQVRVVDFMPAHLEDFAVGRRPTEYDMLSDNGDEANSEFSLSSEDEQGGAGTLDSFTGERVWEWQFALLLEDATPLALTSSQTSDGSQKPKRARIWATVNNSEAQMLMGLDACELRKNVDTLRALREMMFVLWGDLEEKKILAMKAERQARKSAAQMVAAQQKQQKLRELREQREREEAEKQKERERQAREARALAQSTNLRSYPEPPSSDIDEPSRRPSGRPAQAGSEARSSPATTQQPGVAAEALASEVMQKVNNRPFICCLQQYGVRLRARTAPGNHESGDESAEGDDEDDAPRYRWQQMFGLFGTRIVRSF